MVDRRGVARLLGVEEECPARFSEAAGRLRDVRVLPERSLQDAVPGPLRQGPGHKEAPLCLPEDRRFILCGQAPQGPPQIIALLHVQNYWILYFSLSVQ